jgi:Tetratricopeptide repeat/Protein of unknown function (DUF2914)
MAEATLELRAILDFAEQAASVQDFASAERYLRQAATLQEAQLGSNHPELANTLNNLGIVCERTGNSADAEACYRRAYAIASSTLPAEDPLVLTSGQNLRDFCAAIGRPFEPAASPAPPSPPPPAPPIPSPPAPVATSRPAPVPFPARAPLASSPSPRVERGDSRRTNNINITAAAVPVEARATSRHRHAIWVVVGSGILLALVIVLADRLSRSSDSSAAGVTPQTPRAEVPAPREQPPSPVASATPETPVIAAAPERSTISDAAEKPSVTETRAGAESRASRPGSTTVSLVDSKLCRSLSDWRCTPATNPAEPGVFIFYTRVKSARDTRVQHRWYLNGNLRRSVELRVGANPDEGYRTYSRNTVAAERRGDWTIELRDAEGALLHEERFLVQ